MDLSQNPITVEIGVGLLCRKTKTVLFLIHPTTLARTIQLHFPHGEDLRWKGCSLFPRVWPVASLCVFSRSGFVRLSLSFAETIWKPFLSWWCNNWNGMWLECQPCPPRFALSLAQPTGFGFAGCVTFIFEFKMGCSARHQRDPYCASFLGNALNQLQKTHKIREATSWNIAAPLFTKKIPLAGNRVVSPSTSFQKKTSGIQFPNAFTHLPYPVNQSNHFFVVASFESATGGAPTPPTTNQQRRRFLPRLSRGSCYTVPMQGGGLRAPAKGTPKEQVQRNLEVTFFAYTTNY